LAELFFDLVFVFAVTQVSALLHHVQRRRAGRRHRPGNPREQVAVSE